MALIELDPPKVRPRGWYMRLPFIAACGAVSYCQLNRGVSSLAMPAGMRTNNDLSEPPASSSSTLTSDFAESRFANTEPAEPDPTMM